MIHIATFDDEIKLWEREPIELYARIITMLWRAGIKPDDVFTSFEDKERNRIIIGRAPTNEEIEAEVKSESSPTDKPTG
jgi:hypothetical protein